MTVRLFVNVVTTVGAFGAVLVAGMVINPPRGQAQCSNSSFDLRLVTNTKNLLVSYSPQKLGLF